MRPEHLQRPIHLVITRNGKTVTTEELDPGAIFEFVYPWFQDIDTRGRKATIMKELRNSAINQEAWLEIASRGEEPTLHSSAIEWERTMIWGHPTHPMHRAISAQPPSEAIGACDISDMLRTDIAFVSVLRSDIIVTGDFEELLKSLLCTLKITAPSEDRIIIPSLAKQQPAIQKYFPRANPIYTLHGSYAQSNYRTIVLDFKYEYQLKLTLKCRITTAIRTIKPGAACTAPEISKIILALLPKDLWFYEDVASVVGSQELVDEAKQIGCILRLDLEARARANDEALVVSAALAHGTIRDETTYAEKIFDLDTIEKKKTWFRDYTA